MRSDPVAVIGMACRFPRCSSPQSFWKALREERQLISDFSPEALSAMGTSNELLANKNFVPSYGFLEDTDLFDPPFFSMLKREADILDPQHRIFLECCAEALHDARLEVKREKARTAVFAGCIISNYLQLIRQDKQLYIEDPDQFLLELANDKDFLPLRASYLLGLSGPSVNVNAGCATSLVALHLACQSLRARECDIAIAGAASIRHYHPAGYLYREGGVLSPDGRCRPFDAEAKGTVFGDGVACVVIKRLDDALKDDDRIYGLILGSAINNDGRERPSFVAPSVSGQADVIAAAYRAADINPETISYVEAHGTATPLGDRVEVQALTTAFRQFTTSRDFCGLGSVKSNCGHLDAASGMAGLFKTLLAFNYDGIPATLFHNSPNPRIAFHTSPFHVVREFTPWPKGKDPRRAGISSFGMGGVNVHMVLEEPPARTLASLSESTGTPDRTPILFKRVRCWARSGSRHKHVEALASGASEVFEGSPEETRSHADVCSWLYEPIWREYEQALSRPEPDNEFYVVFGAEHAVATELINDLRSEGRGECLAISLDGKRSAASCGAAFVDTDELFSGVTEKMKESSGRRLNIIDFGFADLLEVGNEDVANTAFLAYMRAVSILRKLALEFPAVPVTVTFVTAGAQSVLEGEENNPTLASILGPILVAPQEHPNLIACNIDMPAAILAHERRRTARTLLGAIISAEKNPQIAVRGDKSFVHEFSPLPGTAGQALIKEGGVYLILGGIGTIGPTIARSMLAAGAKQVIVTRRTALSERATPAGEGSQANAPMLTEFGPSILAASVDVNDLGALSSLVNGIASTYGRIDGIVHAAAIPGWETFEFVAQASEANFLKQAAPKINGAINLFKILSDRSGTFCLFLSSLASQLGGLGFCAYSAVSNFVDAYVTHCRNRHGMSWTTINLDNWVLPERAQPRELFGNSASIPRLTPEEGESIFSRLFSFSVPGQVLVSKQDLDLRMSMWRRRAGIAPSTEKIPGVRKTTTTVWASKQEIKQTLLALLKEVFEVEAIDEQASFQELGGDSLQAIEILEIIRETYGVNLEMFELVNASRLDDLVAKISRQLSTSSNVEPVVLETKGKTAQQLVISLRRSDSPPTLFLIHPHGGGVSCYKALVTQLKYSGAICGIRMPGLYGECAPPETVEQMAHVYVQAIKDYQPRGPYLIGGFSAGGIIAFEICRQLQDGGDRISQLIMIDSLAPHHLRKLAETERVDEATFLAEVFLGMIDLPVARLRELSDSEARAWAVKEWVKAGLVTDSFSVENLEPIRRAFYSGLRSYPAYEPARSAFEHVLFIKCIEQPPGDCYREDDLGWGKYLHENPVLRQVPGSHSQLMSREYVSELARQIDESLE